MRNSSTSGIRLRENPFRQHTKMLPAPSTPQTVPNVPTGGAWVSSIEISSTTVPARCFLRRISMCSLLRNFIISSLLTMSTFECTVPPKILKENFPTGLVLISNQAQSQKETAKCVLWIVHFLFFGKYTLLPLCHIAQLADEISVGAIRFRGEGFVKPCESNPLLCQRIVHILDVKSCLDEIPFAFEQGIQIRQCSVVEVFPQHTDHSPRQKLQALFEIYSHKGKL